MRQVLVTEWACDFCGYQGQHTVPDTVDALQRLLCGAPVTSVAEWWTTVEE